MLRKIHVATSCYWSLSSGRRPPRHQETSKRPPEENQKKITMTPRRTPRSPAESRRSPGHNPEKIRRSSEDQQTPGQQPTSTPREHCQNAFPQVFAHGAAGPECFAPSTGAFREEPTCASPHSLPDPEQDPISFPQLLLRFMFREQKLPPCRTDCNESSLLGSLSVHPTQEPHSVATLPGELMISTTCRTASDFIEVWAPFELCKLRCSMRKGLAE